MLKRITHSGERSARVDVYTTGSSMRLVRRGELHGVRMSTRPVVCFEQMDFVVTILVQQLDSGVIYATYQHRAHNINTVSHTQVAAKPDTPEPTTATFISFKTGRS